MHTSIQIEDQAWQLFERAMDTYVSEVSSADVLQFERWLTEHVEDAQVLSGMLQQFPRFGEIFGDLLEQPAAS